MRRHIELVRITAFRVLKVRYRGTALGVLWSFANPLLMTALYTTIFGTAFASYYGGSTSRYVLSAFVGVVVVQFFMASTSEAMVSVVQNGSLLNKIAVPHETFPLSSVFANLFQQCVTTFPIVLLISVFVTRDPLRVALVPVVLVALTALTVGASLALSALFVFFRDLPHLWNIFNFVIWLTSPIFYPSQLVPAGVRAWLSLNPVGQLVISMRDVAIGDGPVHFGPLLSGLGAGVVMLLLGAVLFRSTRDDFMDLV